ncbi:tyrosine-protein phosphatase [Clostridium thermobutyricum]|uniref:Tyrosine-protein phosphatase n=1 Tax=Clostridium thermobutyricum DSM 4928 TaxID=1121339 RepID=A0A1V4SXP6_9CLOT|nr:tyrosine-protein phosphatase [Clostridium thermobutyricum]OPX48369.1 tyrosine-protein phosphatase precursor [Clostridium thermobutyricum DSM 4928]
MENLKGILKRNNDGFINIKLDREVEGKIFYKKTVNDKEKFLIDFKSNEVGFKDPDIENRNFYIVKTEGEEIELAERLIPLSDFCNFRDLGGYYTKDGRMVKWGYFYRSEYLKELDSKDLRYFKTLNIKYVFDYRSKSEVNDAPDMQIEGVKNINIPAMESADGNNENLDMEAYMKKFMSGSATISPKEMLRNSYKVMPFGNEAYKKLIEAVREDGEFAILQHCTAGKDRTGLGSALILLLLGVDEKTVIFDYLESNKYRKNDNAKIINTYSKYIQNEEMLKVFKEVLGVEESFILESLNAIKSRYNTYENYFLQEYGIDSEELSKLRKKYLY